MTTTTRPTMRVSLPPGHGYHRPENSAREPADVPCASAALLDEETSHIASRRGHDQTGSGDARTGLRLVAVRTDRTDVQTPTDVAGRTVVDAHDDEGQDGAEPPSLLPLDVEPASLPLDAEAQFSDLFRAMHTEVRTFTLRRLDHELVDDVVGETFLAVWHGWEKVPSDPSGRRAWVYGVLRNKLLQATQNAGRRARLRSKVTSMRPTGSGPVDEAIESLKAAREILDLLPPAERDAVAFTVLAGLTCAETAEVLGCSVSSVTTRVSRARTRLRTILIERETTEDRGGDRR